MDATAVSLTLLEGLILSHERLKSLLISECSHSTAEQELAGYKREGNTSARLLLKELEGRLHDAKAMGIEPIVDGDNPTWVKHRIADVKIPEDVFAIVRAVDMNEPPSLTESREKAIRRPVHREVLN